MGTQHPMRTRHPTRNTSRAFAVMVAAITVLLVACDDSTGPGAEPAMTASIDGAAWEANYQIGLAVGDYYPARDELQVTGLRVHADSSTQQVTVVIYEYSGPGTYAIGGAGTPAGAYYVEAEPRPDSGVFYGSGEDHAGSVTIEAMDEDRQWVTGTFHFRGVGDSGEVDVTDGSFRGDYVRY